MWGHHAGALDLVLASLLAVTLGSALLLSGRRLARELMLPLLFLAFAIPLPGVITNQLIYPLQISTAIHTGWLLNTIGVMTVRMGNMLHLADSPFQIIESCSGLRSIFVLTTLAVGWLCFFPTRRLSALLLMLSAPLIAYFVNTLRVLSLILNPDSELASTHSVQGVGLFLLGLVIFYSVDKLLLRITGGEEGSGRRSGRTALSPRPPGNRHGHAVALALMLATMLGVSALRPSVESARPASAARASTCPKRIDGWKSWLGNSKPDRLFLGERGIPEPLVR